MLGVDAAFRPKACVAWIRTQTLCARILHKASLTCPVSLLERMESPNFALTIENRDSTLEWRW